VWDGRLIAVVIYQEEKVFKSIDIPTFELKDLVGRSLFIKRTVSENREITSAHDLKTKEIFILTDTQAAAVDRENDAAE
jgi:hypothetical protein